MAFGGSKSVSKLTEETTDNQALIDVLLYECDNLCTLSASLLRENTALRSELETVRRQMYSQEAHLSHCFEPECCDLYQQSLPVLSPTKKLHDESITNSNNHASTSRTSARKDPSGIWQMLDGIRRIVTQQGRNNADSEDKCAKCNEDITAEKPGCKAMEQSFHVDCFTCFECGKKLLGGSFYNKGGSPQCGDCHTNSLSKCAACGKPITEKILKSNDKCYHPECFICTVCKKELGGVPFTTDDSGAFHCVPCYHDKNAPTCACCNEKIIPKEGEKETKTLVIMNKKYHETCFKCQECSLQLSSKIEGHECYPLNDKFYCRPCNLKVQKGG